MVSLTMQVGGAAFSLTKHVGGDEPTGNETTLVAKGKSFLSYFYVGVCSSVLYLPPDSTNDAVLRLGDNASNDATTPVALEIHYHKPARAVDLRWATIKFIEENLPDKKISNLPPNMERQISQFNDLYRNVRSGDRYLLEYLPGIGLRLSLNDEKLGTVGADMQGAEQSELARIIYSVWFGDEAPFSVPMKKELLTPLEMPVKYFSESKCAQSSTTAIEKMTVGSNTMLATSSQTSSDDLSEEEITLLESMGILGSMLEEESGPSRTQPPDDCSPSVNQSSRTTDSELSANAFKQSINSSKFSALTRIHQYMVPPENATVNEVVAVFDSDSRDKSITPFGAVIDEGNISDKSRYSPILLGLGGALFLFPHLAVLLSLPPVLLSRGAPYLPSFGNKLNLMFDMVRRHASVSEYMQRKQASRSLRFVDLGSGDGRVVFRAAREGMFERSVGYEINPALHLFANFRRLVTPRYWDSTLFHICDLWKTKLHRYDVVAVYGLAPIMQRLGTKMERELLPGSIVVSNVFEIPGWKPSVKGTGVYLYSIPECFGGKVES